MNISFTSNTDFIVGLLHYGLLGKFNHKENPPYRAVNISSSPTSHLTVSISFCSITQNIKNIKLVVAYNHKFFNVAVFFIKMLHWLNNYDFVMMLPNLKLSPCRETRQ